MGENHNILLRMLNFNSRQGFRKSFNGLDCGFFAEDQLIRMDKESLYTGFKPIVV